jgi:hypothetical protein
MLKNELDILANAFIRRHWDRGVPRKCHKSDFSKVVSESCSHARQAWAAAAFSDISNAALLRYFNYHFCFLNGMIAENLQHGADALNELNQLMDHLLRHYGAYIDHNQSVAGNYIDHKLDASRLKYCQFVSQLGKFNVDRDLADCLADCLAPVFMQTSKASIQLGALFYREKLIAELENKVLSPVLMTTESLVSTLILLNFNHVHFWAYLRKRVLKGLSLIPLEEYGRYFGERISEIHYSEIKGNQRFDTNWPNIGDMYKDWLNDYNALFSISILPQSPKVSIIKVPLILSVKQLACVIRTLYESGFYGNISLTAIFDHAATVFTTKRQDNISAESIANAYYNISQSSALKVSRMLGNAIDFLKPYCFPR